MSIPVSKILSVSRGVMASADLKNNSPQQTQTVTVNIPMGIKSGQDLQVAAGTEGRSERACGPEPNGPEEPNRDGCVKAVYDENPYASIETRSVETAKISVEDLQKVIVEKDNICKALSLMLDMIENNPLIVNRYVIAEHNALKMLIQLLTNSENVSINLMDSDIGCSCKGIEYARIDKIYVYKDMSTFNFKYSFPEAMKILDDHRISTKLCI